MIPGWVETYIGIPYRENGRDRDGCDCWGLLALIYAEQLGTPLPEYTGKRWEHGDKADQVGPGPLPTPACSNSLRPAKSGSGTVFSLE